MVTITFIAGSAWSAAQLRRKSMSDLHKLYFVLWKERNMLLTEKEYAMSKKIKMDNPARLKKARHLLCGTKQSPCTFVSLLSALANTLLNTLPTRPAQVKQSIARLKLVWDERMKMKTSVRMEEKAIQDRARADENQLRKKRIRQKQKEEKYIQKRMAKFATAVPEQQERA